MADAARARALPVDALRIEAPAERDLVSVLPPLRSVIPGGGLRPGSVLGLDGPGAASLGLALVAGVTGADEGGWSGVVGMPDFGVVAAMGMGAVPERLLLVDEPGGRWPDVVAALIEAVDLVLLRMPERPSSTAVRRLSALARQHGCVLTLTGAFARDWPGTRLRLRLDEASWEGLGDGHGLLQGRRVQVTAEGRDAPGRGRQASLWFPGPDGAVTAADTAPQRRPTLEVLPGNAEPAMRNGVSSPARGTGPAEAEGVWGEADVRDAGWTVAGDEGPGGSGGLEGAESGNSAGETELRGQRAWSVQTLSGEGDAVAEGGAA